MDMLTSFLGRSGFLPHGYCISWTPGVLWSMVGADAVIATAYFSIPLAIRSFLRRRPDTGMNYWVPWLFSAFIFWCGITHVTEIWTIWQPDYGVQALAKIATAAISIVTAVALWPLIPRAVKIPSVHQLQSVIKQLEAEVQMRRTAEEHLRDIEQTLAVALASVEAGFIATDRQGRVTRMNEVAERVTGQRQDEARGAILWNVLKRDDQAAEAASQNPVDAMIEQGIDANTAAQHIVVVARDGSCTPIELRAALTRADDGAVRGLALLFRDVSHLRRAEAALLESEARLRFTLEAAQIGDWDLDYGTGVARRSLRHDRCFGYDCLQPDWGFETFLRHVHPDDRAEVVRRIDAGKAALTGWSGEYRVVWPDASIHWVQTHVTVQHDGGKPMHMLGIINDVTQQKLAEYARLNTQRLEAENRQILEANRLKSEFLANMSHELRTPLNAIIGFADLLYSGAVDADAGKRRVFLGHIGTSGRHLLRLINDVLDLSKVESGRFEFFPEPVNLAFLVKDVTDTLGPAIQAKRIVVATEIDAALSDLVLDPARMKQVLYNYLSNAIKFTPDRGRVTVRALPEGARRFRLEVQDTGVGIAPDDLPRLFTEFQQLDASSSKRHQGTGLGLALTRRLVQAQGGSVGVRSAPGVGSVFHLVLDRVLMSGAGSNEAAERRGRRVLVIEDDGLGQARMVQSLSDAGFQVETASTGEQALQCAQGHAYDAITLDLLLPDRSGLEVLAGIRSGGPSHESPVVGITMPVQDRTGATFAIANVLSKPIRTQEVAAAMARFQLPHRRAKVLVIDDDPLARELMRAALAEIGIDSECVGDGRQALLEIERHRPDAIVLDLMMPEFDGFAALDALRQMPAWCDTPVFVWTSMLLTDDEYASLARSAQAILNKGGGGLATVLDNLRRWRPSVVRPLDRSET